MSYRVVIARMAREEIADAARWISERSVDAALRWLDGIEETIASLADFPTRCSIAPESDVVGIEIRQQLHGRRSGRYRILFIIRGEVVHVIHVRHGARDIMLASDLEFPPHDPS